MPKIREVAVLDIGSRSISAICGRQGINRIINIKGKGEALYSGFSDGKFFEQDKLKGIIERAIRECEDSIKSRIRKIYVGIPGEFCTTVTKEVFISFKSRRKVTDIDVEELYATGEVSSDDFVLINRTPVYYTLDDNNRTLRPVGCSSSKLAGLLSYSYAEKKLIETIGGILDGLGIKAQYICSPLAEALILSEEREKKALFADVGYLTTSVALAEGEGLLFLKSFSCGGAYISADLMDYFKISFPLSEKLKEQVKLRLEASDEDKYKVVLGDESCDVPMKETIEVATARIEGIARTIQKCIMESQVKLPDYLPLLLTGGGISYMRGAADILSRVLDRNVEVVAPRLPQMDKPHLSSSVGLLRFALNLAEKEKGGFWSKLFK
jgi:cell division protein FtsA